MESTDAKESAATRGGYQRERSLTPELRDETHAEGSYHLSQRPQGRGRRSGTALTSAIVVAILLGLGISPRLRQAKKLQAMAAVIGMEVVPVNVVRPQPAPDTTEVVLPASVQSILQTTISARTSGYLRQRFVDIGSRVQAGQTLAIIQAPELDQQLLGARAESMRTEASGEQAQADVARFRANVIQADAELLRSRSNLEAVRADLAHANAKLIETQGGASEARANLMQAERKLAGARAGLNRARARLTMADKTYKRWQALAKGGAVSGQELDETETAYLSAQSDVEAAQSGVDSASADIDAAGAAVRSRDADVVAAQADVAAAREKVNAFRAEVASSTASVTSMKANVEAGTANVRAERANLHASEANVTRVGALQSFEKVAAPFSGVITARNVDIGDLVNAGSVGGGASDPTATVTRTGLFGIARTDVLRLQVNVPQAYVNGIHPGDSARVSVQELPGRVFRGVVFDTAGALDASSRTLLTEIRVPNADNTVKLGMYAQVHFVVRRPRPQLLIAANALIFDAQGTRVASVSRDRKIHFKPVSVGRDFGKVVEVTDGLAGDEDLVTDPTDLLREGTTVHVVANAN